MILPIEIMRINSSRQKLLEIPAPMEPVGGNRLLRFCRLLSAQVLTFIVAYEIYDLVTRTDGSQHMGISHSQNGLVLNNNMQISSQLTVEKLTDYNSYSHDERMQIWFYEYVFEHPQPQLRSLESLEHDGAAPILSKIPSRERDITLVTQTSADRLMALEMSARTWGGEMVVAVHVGSRDEAPHLYSKLSNIHSRIEALGKCRLNIYFALEDGFESPKEVSKALYPVNGMRNVALGRVKTDLVFLLDADFVPNPGLHESLTENEETYAEILRTTMEQRQLLVTPAFEWVLLSTPTQSGSLEIPKTKSELLRGWRNGSIDCFHCDRSPVCHMSTNFEKYFDPATTIPYKVQYREFFEPYIIAAKDLIPRFDGRFRGYGKNKQSHAYHCYSLGFEWSVLPDAFVYAVPHPHSPSKRAYTGRETRQRAQIRGLYSRFKEELKQSRLIAPPILQKTTS